MKASQLDARIVAGSTPKRVAEPEAWIVGSAIGGVSRPGRLRFPVVAPILLLSILVGGCASPSHLEMSLRHRKTYGYALRKDEVSLRWLGVAGYIVKHRETTVLLDPFMSRPKVPAVVFDKPLPPAVGLLSRTFDDAHYIFVGHSHTDHVMDVPTISLITGATIVGSPSTLNAARSYGVGEDKLRTFSNYDHQAGDFRVLPIPNEHPPFCHHPGFICRRICNPGVIAKPLPTPLKNSDMKLGNTSGFLLKFGDGFKIYHHGSAGLLEDELKKVGKVQILLLTVAIWEETEGYLERILAITDPDLVIPTHHDTFFGPYPDDPERVDVSHLSGNFEKFIHTIKKHRPRQRIETLAYFQEFRETIR